MRNIPKNKTAFSGKNGARRARAFGRRIKRTAAFAVCLILILSNFITAFADGILSGNRTVRAGIFSFDGYHTKDEEGRLTGYGIEFLNLVSEYSRLNFQYTGYDKSWSEMLTMLENGEIDVLTSARKTPEREEVFAFSLPIGRNNTVLSIRVDNTQLHRGDYKTYQGMTVGQLEGSSQNQSLVEFAEEKGFSYRTKEYEDSDDLAAALKNGEVDAILSSDLRKAENEKTLDIIEEADFYAIVRKDDTALLDEINYAIEQMDINEGDWKNVLAYRHYGPTYSSAFSFTEREEAYIRQVVSGEKTITVTAIGGRAPFSYTETGKLKGIMPDYFAAIMELAGLPYEIVVPEDEKAYHALTDTNGVSVVLDSAGSNQIVEDAVYSGFHTESYLTARMARVTRQDLSGEIRVVAVSDSQGIELLKGDFLEEYTVLYYPTGEEAMNAVLNREADAAYVYTYTAQLFANHDPTNSLHFSTIDGVSTKFCMYIGENTDHELITILNKCIKQMPDDTLNQLVSRYTSYTIGDMSILQYMQANPGITLTVVIIFALTVCVILVFYLRGRWNRKLLRATEQSNRKMGEQLAIVEALSRDYTNVYAVNEERATARVIKLDGYVTEGLNKGSTQEYHYAPILEQYIRDRVHPDDQQDLAQALALNEVREKLDENEEYQGIYRIMDHGDVHHFQYTYLKIANNDYGQDGFILAGFRNIDEMIRKEQEQKNVLSEALAQAQYANNAKTAFLNNMSHDIRTPMNAIIGFTSLAATHLDNKEQIRDYLDKIMTSGNHLLSLINDVLDMSRIESGKVRIEEKETSLPEVLRDLETIAQADVKAKQLEFRIDVLDVTNETVICDKLRLNQVLLNILSNAMKYTKPGGSVSVRVAQTAAAPEGYAAYEFRIKDTGIGMSREFLQHAFEPFEREQTSTVSGIQGTGLGLTITKNIVDMMGGTITVESEEGKGSEFTVTFCFRVVESSSESQQGVPALSDADPSEPRFDGRRLLLVEDNALNMEIAQTILEAAGFAVDTADDGSVAVERVKEMSADAYDLILMDVQMPIMNGYQATRAIRALEDAEKAAIPIVAMTANVFEEDRKEAVDSGMNGYVAKPIDIEKLMRTLEELLK